MNDFVIIEQHSLAVIEVTASTAATYSFDAAARLADVHPDLLRHYCQAGLLGEDRSTTDQELLFDDDALYALRRIEHYRRQHHVNLRALPLLMGLLHELESLHDELRHLRSQP